jgi:hypothetical protein
MSSNVHGEISNWPSKDQLAAVLRKAGLRVSVGRYSVKVEDCSHFKFQSSGGDLGPPVLDADAETVAEMLKDTERVSAALSRAKLVHRFEVYDESKELVGYFHYEWPQKDA